MIVVFHCYDTGLNEWWGYYEFIIITRKIILDNMGFNDQWMIRMIENKNGMVYCDRNGIICHKYIINRNIIRCGKFNHLTKGILTGTIIMECESQYGMLLYYPKII